jgi:hypothetical protein
MSLNDDPMMKFINLSHLKRNISAIDYTYLDLKYLPLLKQEIALLEQSIIDEDKK